MYGNSDMVSVSPCAPDLSSAAMTHSNRDMVKRDASTTSSQLEESTDAKCEVANQAKKF